MAVPPTPLKSSYLRYLPSVLWEGEDNPPAFSLGTMLLVFEKILTGIEGDNTGIAHGDHQHQAIEEVIANLYQLFDPWQTPAHFLPWLASWLGLTLVPTDEYQCRKAIAEITQIYRQRGLKSALQQYLSLYTVIETRPRIAIDDGSKLLFVHPEANCFAPVHSLVSQGNFVSGTENTPPSFTGLVHPWCLAVAPDGSLFIGDRGTSSQPTPWPFKINSQVWHLSATGAYPFSGSPLVPQPLTVTGLNLTLVEALTVRTLQSGDWELYILDSSGALYRLPSNLGTVNKVTTLTLSLPTAMTVDTKNNLLILERGNGTPRITIVNPDSSPVSITPKPLQQVTEPLSLLVLSDNNLIIGDGREQDTNLPANLVSVNRSDDTNWKESLLLPDSSNPLVAPTALVRQDDDHIFVLDAGLKPFVPDNSTPFITQLAEPAAIYLVDKTQTPTHPQPTITRVSDFGNMAYPTGMVLSQGVLLICDPGQLEVPSMQPSLYRVYPHQFGVVIHFCSQRLPSGSQAQQLMFQIIADITNIVNQEKPAHTLYQIVTVTS